MTSNIAPRLKSPVANTDALEVNGVYARASIVFETARWSKIERTLESLETADLSIRVQVAKGLFRKRVKVFMDGPAEEIDNIIRIIKSLE